jgi:glycosyltransferase involved in cell wall biosynthesis
LQAQTLAPDLWELIVIDNASKEPLAERFDLRWHCAGRHIREEALGLTHARLRGIKESSADFLVFVDDDNVLAKDYLEHALRISVEWPQLGTWGGQCIPEFEKPPEEWTRRWWNWIAIRELTRDEWSNLTGADTSTMPFGAGMCIRRSVANAYDKKIRTNAKRTKLGRTGDSLLGSEDTDICYSACRVGLGNGIFVALKLTHIIPAQRLEELYLLRLIESQTYSATLLRYFEGMPVSRPSRAQRLLKWYQSFYVPERDRRFDQARERGIESARREFEQMGQQEPSGSAS